MRIYVSAKDIKLGLKTPCSNTLCPVARAIRRAGLKGVRVGVELFSSHRQRADVFTPTRVIAAIRGMCAGDGMKPFSFTITNRQIARLSGEA